MLSLPQPFYDALLAYAPGIGGIKQIGHKVHRAADVISAESIDAAYRQLVSHTDKPGQFVRSSGEAFGPAWNEELLTLMPDPIDRMRYLDLRTYLPDDILTKVDRASMATALEVRVPFLDHRIVEWVWRLPAQLNTRAPRPKHLLRRVLARYVPPMLSDRPKTGFAVPLGDWLRGPLRDWAEDFLSPASLAQGPLLAEPVRKVWAAHLRGSNNFQYLLWNILMLQAWQREWGTTEKNAAADSILA
jgi:asparagine synthase (glutamine-hydrolysing)